MKDLGEPDSNPDVHNRDLSSSEEDEAYGQNEGRAAGGAGEDQRAQAAQDMINYKGIYFEDDQGQKF